MKVINQGRVDFHYSLSPSGPIICNTILSNIVKTIIIENLVIAVKTQSNNIAGPYVLAPIQTSVGSFVYYKLSITNPGPNTIFDVIAEDIFNPLLQIVTVSTDVGSAIVTGNKVTWVISSIPAPTPKITYNAIVTVLVLPGGGLGSTIPNFFTAVFDDVNSPPEIEYGPKTSNTVLAEVNVTDSLIKIAKLQRNASMGNRFTDMIIRGYANQTVEYSLTVTNTGANPVYNVVITDLLSNGLSFVTAASVPVGMLIDSGGSTNGVITWSFSPLNPGNSVTAVFSATIERQALGTIKNLASGDFAVTPEGMKRFKAIDSNEVLLDVFQPGIQITGYSMATIFTRCDKDIVCKTSNKKQSLISQHRR